MTKMLERVAKAIAAANEDDGCSDVMAGYGPLAKAALLALKEPDERHYSPIRAAGQWVLVPFSAPVTDCVEANTKAQDVFTAMIDAILKEGGE